MFVTLLEAPNTYSPFNGIDGKPRGTMGIHLDISERKKMESDLREAKLKAEELNKVKEMFLANMSHEIRTPMNAIVGMSELLEQTNLDQSQTSYLSAISSSSKNLRTLTTEPSDSKMRAFLSGPYSFSI